MSADVTISDARVLISDGFSEPRRVAVRAGIIVDEPVMVGSAEAIPAPRVRYESAHAAVGLLREAGVPVLAGTDANATPGVPFSPLTGSPCTRSSTGWCGQA